MLRNRFQKGLTERTIVVILGFIVGGGLVLMLRLLLNGMAGLSDDPNPQATPTATDQGQHTNH